MRFSRALIPTIREAPADAGNVSHALLTRAGFIRKIGAGSYDFLPLGLRVLRKVEAVIRRELDQAGAQEILMPALLPAEYFKETGRWDLYGDVLFRLKDRKGGDYHLGPTHEEIVTEIARAELRSYRDLPMNLYQIQAKFRDEPRPRGGLLRGREFLMKDAYSFDADEAGAAASYETMRQAYCRIFDALGLDYRMVAADPGAIGGSTSAEFQVLVDSGEDAIVACDKCDYAANVEIATVAPPVVSAAHPTAPTLPPLSTVHTPGVGTIADVTALLRAPASSFLKSLVYAAGDQVVLAVVRGDHEVNPVRLARAIGVDEVFLASDAVVEKETGAKVGFAGPVGWKGRVVLDRAAAQVAPAITGANETDRHLIGVVHGRDFQAEIADIRLAAGGDPCPNCDGGKLVSYKGIEGGHIFILGTKYSAKMGATFLDEQQQRRPFVMGCYGIGVSRLVATTIEQHHDESGMRWPMTIAPYQVHLCTLGKDEPLLAAAKTLYDELWARGVEVLWDDRDERPGVKFKDADLIGIPVRVTFGGKSFAAGNVEVKLRSEPDPKKAEAVPLLTALERVMALAGARPT
jgi:prolyl-tRNA synthetase